MTFSPREFLKARRPARFSDTVPEAAPTLDRSLLEYFLDTLTSRSQETDFQRFALALIKRTICPNVLPQTGPTGGGDSKVDSETYPVADSLSLIWYEGIGREAASERWGFAFSTKEKWRDKVQSDIPKLAGTKRGYVKAFFVSNQFVPDKARAEVEDSLSKAQGLDVRILDRTWILDRIFGDRLEAIAIEELRIPTSVTPRQRKGPLDVQREKDLEEVEARIQSATTEGQFGIQFVDDCIEAATLARGLDRPRTEVDGRFLRADRAAEPHGNRHQRLVSSYQRAWTAYWWFEDYAEFAKLYGEAEQHAVGSENASDLELLNNLWNILHTLVKTGELPETDGKLAARTQTLSTELARLRADETRPSSSLQAHTMQLQMRMLSSVADDNVVNAVLSELGEVVRQCEGLIGYPFEPLATIVTEWGSYLGDRPAYEGLFETVTEVTSTRSGEMAAARMLLKRGSQQLEADRPYDAIRSIGRALTRLYKHESRHEAVAALYLIGHAYEQVGLLWAARGSTLTAAALATNEFWVYTDVTPAQEACYYRLKCLELRLGRIPHALAWHELDRLLTGVLVRGGYKIPDLSEREAIFDGLFGIQFLKADLWLLSRLTQLPDVLDSLELDYTAVALRYALGEETDLPSAFLEMVGDEPLRSLFLKWRDQPGAKQQATPRLDESSRVTLLSQIAGCQVSVHCDNAPPYVELAESLLAALESLISTGLREGVISREPTLSIQVRKGDFAADPFEFRIEEQDGRPSVDIRCRLFSPHKMPLPVQQAVKEKLHELITTLLGHVFFIPNLEATLEKLFGDELALQRSIHFTSSFVTAGNVLGDQPKTTLSDWLTPSLRTYALTRTEVWDHTPRVGQEQAKAEPSPVEIRFGDGAPPQMGKLEDTPHTHISTHSLIREPVWERARWIATGFLMTLDNSEPPVLALVFNNGDAARQIFTEWLKEIGATDAQELLRVTIIRGIDKANPSSYRVVVGCNPSSASLDRNSRLVLVSRVNTMTPTSDANLNRFLASYVDVGCYDLTCAITCDGGAGFVPVSASFIRKKQLIVRDAWQVGRNDLDVAGIREDDDPIVPTDEANAPILQLMRSIKERQAARGPT